MVRGVYPEIIPVSSKWSVWLCAALLTSKLHPDEVLCCMHQWLLFWAALDLVLVNTDVTLQALFFLVVWLYFSFFFGLFSLFHIKLLSEFNVISSCVLPTEWVVLSCRVCSGKPLLVLVQGLELPFAPLSLSPLLPGLLCRHPSEFPWVSGCCSFW